MPPMVCLQDSYMAAALGPLPTDFVLGSRLNFDFDPQFAVVWLADKILSPRIPMVAAGPCLAPVLPSHRCSPLCFVTLTSPCARPWYKFAHHFHVFNCQNIVDEGGRCSFEMLSLAYHLLHTADGYQPEAPRCTSSTPYAWERTKHIEAPRCVSCTTRRPHQGLPAYPKQLQAVLRLETEP